LAEVSQAERLGDLEVDFNAAYVARGHFRLDTFSASLLSSDRLSAIAAVAMMKPHTTDFVLAQRIGRCVNRYSIAIVPSKSPLMAALAFALHILGAVVWVGGMFAIYVCLRPALATLEPPQRLRLMCVTFQKFFPWVWTAVLLLLASGYSMLFILFGGFAGAGVHVHLMQGIGWLMIALFVWLFHGPWLAFKRAVDAGDWPSAGTSLDRIRQIISINLPLGLIVVLIGASGRFWR